MTIILFLTDGTSHIVYAELYDLSRKKNKPIKEDYVITLILRDVNTAYYIELQANDDLVEISMHTNDNLNDLNEHDQPCHFHGEIISEPRGFAAISGCSDDGKMVIQLLLSNISFESYVANLDHGVRNRSTDNLHVFVIYYLRFPGCHRKFSDSYAFSHFL